MNNIPNLTYIRTQCVWVSFYLLFYCCETTQGKKRELTKYYLLQNVGKHHSIIQRDLFIATNILNKLYFSVFLFIIHCLKTIFKIIFSLYIQLRQIYNFTYQMRKKNHADLKIASCEKRSKLTFS